MGETIEDMDEKFEFTDNTSSFLADKIGVSDEQKLQELEQVSLTVFLDKTNRVRLKITKNAYKTQNIQLPEHQQIY